MDHQVFAEMLGNCGEFFGALAVVVTLGYLAFQVRQNTRSSYVTRSNEHLGWSDNIAGEFGLEPNQYALLSSHYFRIIGHLRDAYVSQLPEGERAALNGQIRNTFTQPALSRWFELNQSMMPREDASMARFLSHVEVIRTNMKAA